jgi:hypothetical protein
MKPRRTLALRPWKIVEDSAWTLAQKLDKPDPNRRVAFGVKWCCCRFKVFGLEHGGRHYCRCGYPIKSYAIYDMSPLMQALWPISVILGAVSLAYAVTPAAMRQEGRPPDCDNIVLACPNNGKPLTCEDIVVTCFRGG